MHPVFHPITLCYIRSAVVLLRLPAYSFSLFAILALSTITISDSILTIDVTLDRQNVHLLCILISTHLLHFMTAEIASILRQCFDLVNYSLSSVGGLHASSSRVWTRQTGYSVGVTVRLESALSVLDLVKKMERVKERRSSNHATKDHPEEITKNLHGRFCINSYFIKFVGQNLIN